MLGSINSLFTVYIKDLLLKFMDHSSRAEDSPVSSLKSIQDLPSYLVIIEHTMVSLICLLDVDEQNTQLVGEINLSHISQLIRYKRESLSIITCTFINVVITNCPLLIPNFLKAELISDLIYGVKNNPKIGAEVMNILALISSLKSKITNDEAGEWHQVADE